MAFWVAPGGGRLGSSEAPTPPRREARSLWLARWGQSTGKTPSVPSCPLTDNICLGGPALSGGKWALSWGGRIQLGGMGFKWETCLSPAGHCDLHPPIPHVEPPLLSCDSFLFLSPHLPSPPGKVTRGVGGKERGSRQSSRAGFPRQISFQRPQLQICPQGKETSPPPFGCPVFSLRKSFLIAMSCLFQRNPVP